MTMNNKFIALAKQNIHQMTPYVPGKPIEETARELGLDEKSIIKLASNENPLGTSTKVKEIISAAVPGLSLYPDGSAFMLKKALSVHLGIDTSRITPGNGSDELLRLLAMAYAGPGDEVIFSQYSFVVYMLATLSVSAKPVVVPASSWGADIDHIVAAVNENTRIIYIANPNNPTGTWLSPDQIQSLLKRINSKVIVVLDEAYIEYSDDTDIHDSISWTDKYQNLVITRTFSKAYGMAGLRIGYAIANPQITDVINRVRPPFNVNEIAQKAAVAALSDQQFIKLSQQNNQKGMQELQQGFKTLGLNYIPSKGNFITVDVDNDNKKIAEQLLSAGIIVRPLNGYKMPRHIRVTVGSAEENAKFLKVLSDIL